VDVAASPAARVGFRVLRPDRALGPIKGRRARQLFANQPKLWGDQPVMVGAGGRAQVGCNRYSPCPLIRALRRQGEAQAGTVVRSNHLVTGGVVATEMSKTRPWSTKRCSDAVVVHRRPINSHRNEPSKLTRLRVDPRTAFLQTPAHRLRLGNPFSGSRSSKGGCGCCVRGAPAHDA